MKIIWKLNPVCLGWLLPEERFRLPDSGGFWVSPGWSWGNDKQTFGRFKLFSRGESHALGPAESGNLISMTFCFITILRGWTKDGFFCRKRRRRGYFGERVITGFFFCADHAGQNDAGSRFCQQGEILWNKSCRVLGRKSRRCRNRLQGKEQGWKISLFFFINAFKKVKNRKMSHNLFK